jgi:hypothetical protein
MAIAQFALPQRPALSVGESGEHGPASLALAHAASRRVSAGKQLNLHGHASKSLTKLARGVRPTLSARNELKHNADGSVDLYLQNADPGKDKESNWLPAPADNFILCCGHTGPRKIGRHCSTGHGPFRR